MNLANKAFKGAFLKWWKGFKGRVGQTLGESATEVSMREMPKITDPEKLKGIAEKTKEFSSMVSEGGYMPKAHREAEATMRSLTKESVERGQIDFDKFADEFLDPAIDRIIEGKMTPTERRQELTDIADKIKAYYGDPKFPMDASKALSYLDEGNYRLMRDTIQEGFIEKSLAQKDRFIDDGLREVFADDTFVENIISANRETRLRSIFQPRPENKDGLSKFDEQKLKYIKKETKGMDAEKQKVFVDEFNKKYSSPEDVATADLADLEKKIDWYNQQVSDKDKVHYNLRDQIQDKVRIISEANKELAEFGVQFSAKDWNENTILKWTRKGSGLVTNMGRVYSAFKGVETFTAKSIGRAADYLEKLPVFKTRNNELLMSAGVEFSRYGKQLPKEEQKSLQSRIRSYIENLSNGRLTKVEYNNNELTINAELAQQYGLNLQDVEFANKVVNALRISKKHMDFVESGNYEAAKEVARRFRDIDGLNLEDVSMLNKNHPTFGFVQDYFPIVPTDEYKNFLMQQRGANDPTQIGYVGRQMRDLIQAKHDDLNFFHKMRKIGKDSHLKNSPNDRLSPAEELLTYAKAVDNFYKDRGYSYFDQIETAHSLYNVINNYGKDEQLGRVKMLQELRQQYDEAMNPKSLGDGAVANILSAALTTEMTVALSSPRMSFFNLFQGLELGGALTGYTNHAKAIVKNLFGASGWALHEILSGGKANLGNAKFIEECWRGKFEKGLLYGDDAVIAKNIMSYFHDEPLAVINFADVKYLLTKGVDEKLRMKDTLVGRTLTNLAAFATYGFQLSEKLARASTVEAATRHYLKSAQKTLAHLQTHPEMTNPEAVRFLAKELHLDAFGNTWKVDKILDNVKGKNLMEALSDNAVIQRMSQDYAFAAVKHQNFEYDAINQSWLKSKAKHTSAYLGIPLTFKSWGMYFTEYFAGIAAAAYNGDPKPLIKFGTQALTVFAAASWATHLMGDEKYKRGEPKEFEDWLRKGAVNVAKYAKGRNAALTPLSIMQQPLDEMAGLTKPAIGGGLWLSSKALDLANRVVTLGQDESVVFPYLEKQGMDAMTDSVTARKINDLVDNLRELKLIEPKKK